MKTARLHLDGLWNRETIEAIADAPSLLFGELGGECDPSRLGERGSKLAGGRSPGEPQRSEEIESQDVEGHPRPSHVIIVTIFLTDHGDLGAKKRPGSSNARLR